MNVTDKEASSVIEFTRRLVKGKMDVEKLSYRQMSLLCEVSPAAICRFLQGRMIDAVTFLKFCAWIRP